MYNLIIDLEMCTTMETKPRILYLQKILLERTDEENPLSTTQLINKYKVPDIINSVEPLSKKPSLQNL